MQSNILVTSSSFYDYFFSPQNQISSEEHYQQIIQSWRPQYWHMQGFKTYDIQTLVKVMQDDINHQKITIDNLLIILKKLELYPIANQYQNEFKQTLQIVQNRVSAIILQEIHQKILKISQENTTLIIPAVGTVQTINEYIQSIQDNLEEKKRKKRKVESIDLQTIGKNFENFDFIIDSRGDGNCGYRSVIVSSYMNNPIAINNYFKTLLNEKFVTLFMQYDKLFQKENRKTIGTIILHYLLSVLVSMNKKKTLNEFTTILNQEITFDYYMIMFMRYMIADYIEKNNLDELSYSTNPKNRIIEEILTWKNELDDLETTLLAKATAIQTQTIQENAEQNAIVTTNSTNPIGHAYIAYTISPGHYKILVKDHVKRLPKLNQGSFRFYSPYL